MSYLRTRIKMCGMTREEDIQYAVSLGVDAIGLIFYEKSPRYVSIEKATQLLQGIPPFITVVAVVVNPAPSWLTKTIAALPIQALQFHGDESPIFCEQFGLPFIKAIPALSAEFIIKSTKEYSRAAAILIDTPSETRRGGTGVTFDWRMVPTQLDKPLILSGGLHANNVEASIKMMSPYAVDVCSGIEASEGIKDCDKMAQFVKAIEGLK